MYDERLARQYRYEPPSEFPQTSPFTGIVHHLSGPNKYAHAQTSPNRSVGYWCKHLNNHFHCAHKFNHPWTRICVRLLGPCFKTGRIEQFSHNFTCQEGGTLPCVHTYTFMQRYSQHDLTSNVLLESESCKEHSSSRSRATMSQELSPPSNRRWRTRQEASLAFRWTPTTKFAFLQRGISIAHDNLTMQNWFHPLSFQRVQALLTLFSKSFSSFPHGTCLLSVSDEYVAWDEIYHPFCAPIPRNVTRRKTTVNRGLQTTERTLTLNGSLFQAACVCAPISNKSWDYNSKPAATIPMLSLSQFIRHYFGSPI